MAKNKAFGANKTESHEAGGEAGADSAAPDRDSPEALVPGAPLVPPVPEDEKEDQRPEGGDVPAAGPPVVPEAGQDATPNRKE